MCTSNDPDFCADTPADADQITPAPVAPAPSPGLGRRTFLKAAALGSAAAALRTSVTLAHTDTKSACTAQDIEVLGGQIINEPCNCSPGGTFTARAQFTVINNNNSRRKCITLHLGSGGTLGGRDYLLKDENGVSNIGGQGDTRIMFADLGELPCNFAQECYEGSVIAFQTAQNASDAACPAGGITKYPGGQCRRQTICITGFNATLNCGDSCEGATSDNCSVACGGSLTLQASAIGASAGADPNAGYTFTITDPNGNVVASVGPGAASPQCFTVANPVAGTYTLSAADNLGCARTDTTTVSVESITADLASSPGGCSGSVRFTGTSTGTGTCSYQFLVDGAEQQNSDSNEFIYRPISLGTVDGADHTVTLNVNCGGCQASASRTVNTCASTTVS